MEKVNDVIEQDGPWRQLYNEPDEWYDRFRRYLLMGPGRDIKFVYYREWAAANEAEEEREGVLESVRAHNRAVTRSSRVPVAWEDSAILYKWKDRARLFDDYELAIEKAEHDAEKNKFRERRVHLLNKAYNAIDEYVDGLLEQMRGDTPSVKSLRTLTYALKTFNELTRREYGEDKQGNSINNFGTINQIHTIEIIKDKGGERIIEEMDTPYVEGEVEDG